MCFLFFFSDDLIGDIFRSNHKNTRKDVCSQVIYNIFAFIYFVLLDQSVREYRLSVIHLSLFVSLFVQSCGLQLLFSLTLSIFFVLYAFDSWFCTFTNHQAILVTTIALQVIDIVIPYFSILFYVKILFPLPFCTITENKSYFDLDTFQQYKLNTK